MIAHATTIPVAFAERLEGYACEPIGTGQSDAKVYRLSAPSRPTMFLKHEALGEFSEIRAEAAALRWLGARQFPCASVIDEITDGETCWLLTSQVEGRDLSSARDLEAHEIIAIAAQALRRLHELDIAGCPFDRHLHAQVKLARSRVDAGLVDPTDFDEKRQGQTAGQLFAELLARQPTTEDLVVTHGDATFENLIENSGRFSGFIDCGRLGIADRYRDLALVARSIEDRLGPQWIASFFELYGLQPDPARIGFYQLLDEFF